MIRRTSRYLVPFALGAMALFAVVLTGCSKSEEPLAKPPVVKADPPSVYMKDKDFRAALDEKRAERQQVLGVREKLLAELEKRVDAMRAKMPGADDAAVKKELEKDPEWNSLIKKIEDANAAFDDNRKATTKIVGDRIAPRPQEPKK